MGAPGSWREKRETVLFSSVLQGAKKAFFSQSSLRPRHRLIPTEPTVEENSNNATKMFTTLRVFNTRVAKQGKIQNADAPASSAPMHPHMQFMPHSKNSSQGRMISMAQAWTRKATERQMTHGLRYHPLPGLHVRSLSTSRT